ncbi:MAG TPA: hypothetical protein IAC36_02405 [Candidatus Aphodomonas merdavium]|nr:hypothetical protein [Candidatus Aphodomonas merdavium]
MSRAMRCLRAVRRCPLFTSAMALLLALAVAAALLPARDISQMENRVLQKLSAPTVSSVLSGRFMTAAETALSDQFPLRDRFVQLNLLRDVALLRREFNGILRCGDRLLAACDALDGEQALRAVEALVEIQRACAVPMTLLLAPLPSRLYAASLPAHYEADDQAALTETLRAAAGESILFLDCYAAMAAQPDPEALYYRTDHHWTAEGARCAYERLAAAWGFSPALPDNRLYASGFYGSYYARAPFPFFAPDTLCFDRFDNLVYCIDGQAQSGLWDEEALAGRDKYAALLYGNHGRATLLNQSGAASGTLLVLKDSYANALLPALAQHYERLEIVDPRYYAGDLRALLEETEAEEILCIFGMNTFLTDRSLSLLAAGL